MQQLLIENHELRLMGINNVKLLELDGQTELIETRSASFVNHHLVMLLIIVERKG